MEFLRRWVSFSEPILVRCDDDTRWVVKGSRGAGRGIVNECVVGWLGRALGAPVAEVGIVEIPASLVAQNPELERFKPGLAHGSRYIPDCHDQTSPGPDHCDEPENRERFALLGVLYSWIGVVEDHQLIYRTHSPHLVYSVDHGHAFPGPGVLWTEETLGRAEAARLDPWFGSCHLSGREMEMALGRLNATTEREIARAVAAPLEAWHISPAERVALARYLWHRRAALLGERDAARREPEREHGT